MPISKTFDSNDIQSLLNMNNKPPFGLRNAVIIVSGVYWGLTPLEQSKLAIMDVINEQGTLRREIEINSDLAYNDVPRVITIADHLKPVLEAYINWLIDNGVNQSGCESYRGLVPTGAFIVNDKYQSFPLIKRSESGAYTANAMNKKITSLIKNTNIEGARVSTLRDSWIKELYNNGLSIKELMAISGIKSKQTLDSKLKPTAREMSAVINDIYSRVKL